MHLVSKLLFSDCCIAVTMLAFASDLTAISYNIYLQKKMYTQECVET